MGLRDFFRRDDDWEDPSEIDPGEAMKRAEDGLERTSTFVDANGRRRPMPERMRRSLEQALDRSGGKGRDDGER